MAGTARSRSASLQTIKASSEPVSRSRDLPRASACKRQATAEEPVKLTRLTCGCAISRSALSAPPVTTLITPAGKESQSRTSSSSGEGILRRRLAHERRAGCERRDGGGGEGQDGKIVRRDDRRDARVAAGFPGAGRKSSGPPRSVLSQRSNMSAAAAMQSRDSHNGLPVSRLNESASGSAAHARAAPSREAAPRVLPAAFRPTQVARQSPRHRPPHILRAAFGHGVERLEGCRIFDLASRRRARIRPRAVDIDRMHQPDLGEPQNSRIMPHRARPRSIVSARRRARSRGARRLSPAAR